MRLVQFLLGVAMTMVQHETTRSQQSPGKLGGMDVLAIVIECKWNNITNLPWKMKVFDCLDRIFDFGPADHQSRFRLECSMEYSYYSSNHPPVQWNQNRHPGDADNATCTGTDCHEHLQWALQMSSSKLRAHRRKNASVVTFLMSDANLGDTTLEWPASYLTIEDNVLFVVVKMDETPSENHVKLLAGGRNESRVIHIPNPIKEYSCTESDMNKVKKGLCGPVYHEILNVTACTLVNATEGTCERVVTYNPQLQRADVICPGLLSTNTEPCECPNTTTTATTAIITSTTGKTTAAGPGALAIVAYCAAAVLGLLGIGVIIFCVWRKKKQRSAAKHGPNKDASGFKKSPVSKIASEPIKKIASKSTERNVSTKALASSRSVFVSINAKKSVASSKPEKKVPQSKSAQMSTPNVVSQAKIAETNEPKKSEKSVSKSIKMTPL